MNSAHPTGLVTNGTYSLCRHPATLWLVLWMVSAVLVSKSVTLAVAAPVWIAANIGCLFWEEYLCCQEDIGDEYKRYKETTPMVIPTRTSIRRFWKQLKLRFGN